MTNIIDNKVRGVLAVAFIGILIVFTVGLKPHLAFAQDDSSFSDGGDDSSLSDGGDDSSLDDGGDDSSYSDPETYYDDGGGTYYDDPETNSDDGTYYDDPSSCDSSCYTDTGYSEDYSTDCGCEEYDTQPEYTEEDYYETTPSYSSTPMTISAPPSYSISTPSTPIYAPVIPQAPIVQNIPIAYQQQQQQQQQIAPQPAPVTNNTCVNYSCNTVTSINNSGNTTTVIPIAAAPVTYPVQYTIPNYQNVSCTISVSQNSIQSGQYAYLTWQSYGAVSATLSNYGNVAPNGSLSVRPYGSTNYVLTVYGQNGQTSTCNTYVTMANTYPSVTLSQIPYTGFDFGAMGDAIYFSMLALFALAAGYLLVYYKGGMAVFAGSMVPVRRNSSKTVTVTSTQSVEKKAAPIVEKKIETPTPSPIRLATLESLPTFTQVRPTSDTMTIANKNGAPHIVISRD